MISDLESVFGTRIGSATDARPSRCGYPLDVERCRRESGVPSARLQLAEILHEHRLRLLRTQANGLEGGRMFPPDGSLPDYLAGELEEDPTAIARIQA